MYLGTERNTPVIPTLSMLPLSVLLAIYFYLCVDATGVVCHQLGLLDTDLHALGCGGFVKTLN